MRFDLHKLFNFCLCIRLVNKLSYTPNSTQNTTLWKTLIVKPINNKLVLQNCGNTYKPFRSNTPALRRNLSNTKSFTMGESTGISYTEWKPFDMFTSESDDYALLVLNQPILVQPEFMVNVWKKAKLRITVDGGSNRWLKFIESLASSVSSSLPLPDLITGDFDSISEVAKTYFKEKNVTFIETPDQDETDFTKALRVAKKVAVDGNLKLNHILTLIETSGRLDQIMANLETLYHARKIIGDVDLTLMQLSSDSLTWLLKPGQHMVRVNKTCLESNYWCGLIPLSGPTIVTTTGLKWDLTATKLAFGELVSTSNTYSQENVFIDTDNYLIWTMQIAPEND